MTGCHRNSVAVRDFRLQGFLEEVERVITDQQGKDPDLARYVSERVRSAYVVHPRLADNCWLCPFPQIGHVAVLFEVSYSY